VQQPEQIEKTEDVPGQQFGETVVRSMCGQCWNGCGIRVYVKDGIVTKVMGDPENPHSNGFICAKGQVGPQSVYSPYRVTKPLMRTNPEKGLEVDPKWKEISWDEATTIIAERMKKIRKEDPRKVMMTSFDTSGGAQENALIIKAFGSPNFTPGSADYFCGNSVHTMHYLNQAAFHGGVDFKYCRYILQVGTQWGSIVNANVMASTTELAEARAENRIRMVVVDPWASFAGSKANEWVPIRPGTDAAFLLSMVNVIINELGIYDEPFLKHKTNAPYLVGDDKLYVKDKEGKPMVWDIAEKKAKSYDDPSVKDYALLGDFKVNGKTAHPGFQLIKDHVKKYTPEYASEITTIPAATIRRLAKEWVDNAHIGETIEIDGYKLPFRPVAVNWYRGASAHKHSAAIGYAIMMLPTLVGAVDVPGGAMGENRMPSEGITDEGLLTTTSLGVVKNPYPGRPVTAPDSVFFFELFPIGPYSPVMVPLTQLHPDTYHPPYQIDLLFQLRNNFVKSSGPSDVMGAWVKMIPFVVSISTHIDETATLSDIVLPDLTYLERNGGGQTQTHPGITGPKYAFMQNQAVKPPFAPPFNNITSSADIFLEIAYKAGFLDDVNDLINKMYGFKGPKILEKGKRYTAREITDRRLKTLYGEEHGLDWFRTNGVLITPKDAKYAYAGAFRKARIHLYYEFIERAGAEVERTVKELGIPWETEDYQNIPDWKPCPSFNPKSPDYDIWLISSKIPMHTLSGSIYYPTLQAMAGKHKFDKGVFMNAATAAKKGIQYGDTISIESETGKKQKAIALTSEVVHPEVVVCFGSHGRKVAGIPNARYIGVDFNAFLELDPKHIDFVDGALDSCIRVKVQKEA
jgi:anaerobic selenocysteine-containing dehydrogenase